MHEFSIAHNIIEIVEDTARQNNLTHVEEVELDIGELSGIDIPALETALECLIPQSFIEGANFKINRIRGIARCRVCRQKYATDDLLSACPTCDNYGPEIISGKEMRVKSISAE
jgi:hydrogenase nickel incorporation protein HypA/HybF